ncbi:MAG: T9SS type A sorting domain-containing protein [Sphingobacteriaceae bacterium]|nr:T9SS type A sorting domain-containing protein [Sphingobacteriaceae bacterium]
MKSSLYFDYIHTVDQSCTSNNPCVGAIPSRISRFDYGVRAENTNPLRTVTVRNSEFYDNTTVGSYFNNMHSFFFENNYMRTPGENCWAAAYLNECKNYTFKNNTLLQDYSVTQKVFAGVYAMSSAEGAHKIYRNTFSNFHVGIAPVGNNSGILNVDDGLLMNCNDFTQKQNDYDIGLVWQSTPPTPPTVMKVQGPTIIQNMTAQNIVRNKYAADCFGNENKWYLQGTNARNFIDYDHGCNGNPVSNPSACDDISLYVFPVAFAESPSDCPANIVQNGCTPPCLEPINLVLGGAIVQTNSLVNYYNSIIDGGNTQILLNAINSGMGEGEMKNLLLQYSPYLSDTVLSAYFNRTNWPLGHGVQIHNANKPVSIPVWQVILNRNPPSGILSQLNTNQNQNPTSVRSGLEQRLSLSKFNLQSLYSEKLNYFLTDSLPSSQDSVINILQSPNVNIPDADVLLVYAYINKGDYLAALNQVNKLPAKKSDWVPLLKLYIEAAKVPQKELSIFESSTGASLISDYAKSITGIAGQSSAKSLLKFLNGEDYIIEHPIPINDNANGRMAASQSELVNEDNIIATNNQIKLYPNPTNSGIYLSYESSAEKQAELLVTDLLGKVIINKTINGSSKIYIPLTEISSGLYLITILDNEKVIFKSKLIKYN